MGHCLPGSSVAKGLVVDIVVEHNNVGGGSRGVYRRIKGGRNNKYTAITAIRIQDMANVVLAVF